MARLYAKIEFIFETLELALARKLITDKQYEKMALQGLGYAATIAGGLSAPATGGISAPVGVAFSLLANKMKDNLGSNDLEVTYREQFIEGLHALMEPPRFLLGGSAGPVVVDGTSVMSPSLMASKIKVLLQIMNKIRYCSTDLPTSKEDKDKIHTLATEAHPVGDSEKLGDLKADAQDALKRYVQLESWLTEYSGSAGGMIALKALETVDTMGDSLWGTPGMMVDGKEGNFGGVFGALNR